MIFKTPLLTSIPVTGQYRYCDLLQIIPPKTDDPRPPCILGWYGATLAIDIDKKAAHERTVDNWAYEHRERARIEFLKSKASSSKGSEQWLDKRNKIQTVFKHRPAIEHEAFRLLQTLINVRMREPKSDQNWYSDPDTHKPIYAQGLYPSLVMDPVGEFWEGQANDIPMVNPIEHYGRRGIGMEDTCFTLPADIEIQLDKYFALPPEQKITFARACELFGNAQDLWATSKSLSLVAYVFAIEALCHVDDPKPARCKECSNLLSEDTCTTCRSPKFGLTRRFKEFVEQYIDFFEENKFVAKLFNVRSEIAHSGLLLRADEFDAGFHAGGKDNQFDLENDVGMIARQVLLGWISASSGDHQ